MNLHTQHVPNRFSVDKNALILLVLGMTLRVIMGQGGLEPPTSPLSGVRSNQLSYRPIRCSIKIKNDL